VFCLIYFHRCSACYISRARVLVFYCLLWTEQSCWGNISCMYTKHSCGWLHWSIKQCRALLPGSVVKCQ